MLVGFDYGFRLVTNFIMRIFFLSNYLFGYDPCWLHPYVCWLNKLIVVAISQEILGCDYVIMLEPCFFMR